MIRRKAPIIGRTSGSTIATTHGLVGLRMRALSSAILFLILNIIGLGLGPLLVGVISDYLQPQFGNESLRLSLHYLMAPVMAWSTIHFFIAALLSRIFNGNLLASLSGTFFGNPLTYVPIGVVCLQTGHFLLGDDFEEEETHGLMDSFFKALSDLKNNFMAMFTGRDADWRGLSVFYDEVFFPYLIGGIFPGLIAGYICYYLSLPVVRTYQQRRRARIKAKFDEIKRLAETKAAVPVANPLGSGRNSGKESSDV